MKDYNAKQVIKRYNDIMFSISREHNTIGTSYSEGTEMWNLRDLVSEMQYTLDMYEDTSCIYWEEAHEPDQPKNSKGVGIWYSEWVSVKNKMKRFIKAYEPFIGDMICHEGHCSIYD